ncbi:MAG: DNA recombination protein RmuC [Gemmatimonadales bacterium]|nr:DNA recombination protein RmuC [Gemmatimonadales bacterium]
MDAAWILVAAALIGGLLLGWIIGSRHAARADTRLRESFTAIAADALRANNDQFLTVARASMGEFQQGARSELDARAQAIDHLVRPMHEGLARVDARLQAFDRDRAAGAASLQEHLRSMAVAQQQLTGETQQLVRALRAPQGRGQWGELQLRRVVELAGMQEHCDFSEQVTVGAEGARLRPDLVVHLPGGKTVIVDAKAPLSAYLDALDANDDTTRGALLDQHARQVRDHVTALSRKDYASQFAEAPDFVVLFLPGEAFFSAACLRDAGLIEYATSRGVIPASPTTLITVLKAVSHGWQQERVARNTALIRDEAVALHDRMRTVGEHLDRVRRGLAQAVTAYNGAIGSLEARVLPTARRLRDLGAGQGDAIDTLIPVEVQPRSAVAEELAIVDPDAESSDGRTDRPPPSL